MFVRYWEQERNTELAKSIAKDAIETLAIVKRKTGATV